MSSFTSELIVEPLEDGKTWILKRPFTYHVGSKYSKDYVKVPRGFKTDFASVPKIFTLMLPSWAKFQKSAVLHDYLYRWQGYYRDVHKTVYVNRKEADDIFLEAMLIEFRNHKSGKFIAYLEYWAVRLFAQLAWK